MKDKETIEYLKLKSLVPFWDHPFKSRDGEEKEQLLQSIKTQGAIKPLDTLYRYIRLTCLIPELLEKVDKGKIALTPAVELSYLTNEEQQALLNEIEYADDTPSLSQAQRLRIFSRQGKLTADVVFAVLSEEKTNQKSRSVFHFPKEEIQKYFPKNYTGKDMQDTILKLLEKWRRQRERQREGR